MASSSAEARLAGLVDSAMDAIISVDPSQRIVLYNRAAERIFGWPAAEMIGQPLERLLPERFRRGHADHVRRFGSTGVTTRRMSGSTVVYGIRKNGEPCQRKVLLYATEDGRRWCTSHRPPEAVLSPPERPERPSCEGTRRDGTPCPTNSSGTVEHEGREVHLCSWHRKVWEEHHVLQPPPRIRQKKSVTIVEAEEADVVVERCARRAGLDVVAKGAQRRPHFHAQSARAFGDRPRHEHLLLLRRAGA